jgi:hypothetical protein
MLLDLRIMVSEIGSQLEYYEANFDLVSLPGSFNLWLASPEARFLKGKFLWANWDVDELKARAKEIESSAQLSIGLTGWPFGDPNWKATWN